MEYLYRQINKRRAFALVRMHGCLLFEIMKERNAPERITNRLIKPNRVITRTDGL